MIFIKPQLARLVSSNPLRDQKNGTTAGWDIMRSGPSAIETSNKLEQLRCIVAMVPLADEPAVKFLFLDLDSVGLVLHPRPRTVASGDGDGLPPPVVGIGWEAVDAEGKRRHIEQKTCSVEVGR